MRLRITYTRGALSLPRDLLRSFGFALLLGTTCLYFSFEHCSSYCTLWLKLSYLRQPVDLFFQPQAQAQYRRPIGAQQEPIDCHTGGTTCPNRKELISPQLYGGVCSMRCSCCCCSRLLAVGCWLLAVGCCGEEFSNNCYTLNRMYACVCSLGCSLICKCHLMVHRVREKGKAKACERVHLNGYQIGPIFSSSCIFESQQCVSVSLGPLS